MSFTSRVDAVIDAAIGPRIVGCAVLIQRKGQPVYRRIAGFADREAERKASDNEIFRLASCTKPIVAATALRMLDAGLLSLDEPVTKYLPFFTPKAPDGTTPEILIRHLLSHTSGLTYDNGPENVSRGADPRDLMPLTENLRRLARNPLSFAPGTAWGYGMSIDVLGGVVATINRSELEDAVAVHVTGPLGMADTHFFVADKERLAVPYGDGKPRPYRFSEPQQVENAPGVFETFSPKRIFQSRAPHSGGSGMAGTAADFMKLLEALRAGPFLTAATREAALANQIGDLVGPDGCQKFSLLGAYIDDPAASGWPAAGMLHWGGIWGNNWILDPASGTAVVVMTNTMREGCNGPFREEIRDAVFG